MKTPMRIILAALLLVLLCLPASAEVETVNWAAETIAAIGDTRKPWYPDYSSRCGENVTLDDFNVTYLAVSGKDIKVAKDGTITVPDTLKTGTYYVEATYTPKKSGVGKKSKFTLPVKVIQPLTRISCDVDTVYVPVDGKKEVQLYITGGSKSSFFSTATFDTSLISVGKGFTTRGYYLTIKGKSAGETDLTMMAYNGIVQNLHVVVVGPVTKAEYGSEHFTCYVGDNIDLALDLGNGPHGPKASWNYSLDVKRNGGYYHMGILRYATFDARETGEYTMELEIEGFEASTQISVYDRANCADIQIPYGDLTIGSAKQVKLYDASGNAIYRPMAITAGRENAKIQYDKVIGVAAGSFTITVQNEDGSTTSKTFTVGGEPNLSVRETIKVTLDIGETFDILPDFADANRCTYYCAGNNSGSYDLYSIRMEGNTIVAQSAGSTTVRVTFGDIEAWVDVTVRQSDKEIRIVMPEEPIGIGQTFQLTVQDEAGNIYPATFGATWGCVNVTPDGLLTGLKEGWYSVNAELDDGRRVKSDMVEVKQIPARLMHPSITARLSDGNVPFETIESDVGSVALANVKVEIEDESIATKQGNQLYLHKAGTTLVTLTAVNGGATTSFTLTVLADQELFIGSDTLRVPYGYGAYLPKVLDKKGNELDVSWEITHDVPGAGNPEASGFSLEGDTIICLWPYASCEVTGTTKNGMVKINVQSYKIVEEISLNRTEISMNKGGYERLELVWDATKGEPSDVTWVMEDENIAKVGSSSEGGTQVVIWGVEYGTTRVAAILDNGVYAVCDVKVYNPSARLPGDANDDGTVDIHDALLVMQHDAGWNVSINGYAADVNADGTVNGQDGLLLLQYSAGLDVELRQYVPEK